MRTFIILMFALASCVSPMRTPASVRDFETLPLCSRIKFVYASPRISMDDLTKAFDSQAYAESKQIWVATEVMARDTGGKCLASTFADLIERPQTCLSDEWAGPYVDARALASYARLTPEDFEAFRNCWR